MTEPTVQGTLGLPPLPKMRLPSPPPPKAASSSQKSARKPTKTGPSLKEMITIAFEKGYSDVHLGVGEVPRFRDRGAIVTTEYPETDNQTFMSWLQEVLSEEQIRQFQKNLEFDGATQYDFARLRINVFDSLTGYGMVLVFKDVSSAHKGLILVTGPTGCGKSTTMAAMVDYINKEHPRHIITIEDPIEFVHKSRKSLIKQREVGIHTLEFDKGLKASLREDPDVILIGEMRDRETVNTALKAAQTGYLVMGTLHSNSAVKSLERILSLYDADERPGMRVAMAESLVAIISQGLCPTTDGKRIADHDILVNTETIKEYIRDGKNDEIPPLMQEGDYDGMTVMNKSLFKLYFDGKITEETALEYSPARNEMSQMLRGRY